MIEESLEYPRKRFVALVKKYFYYRRSKQIRERFKQLKLEGSLSQRVTDYLKLLEQRSEMVRRCVLIRCVKKQLGFRIRIGFN